MAKFLKVFALVSVFILFVMTMIHDLNAYVSISDLTLMIIVMMTVTVLPALGKIAYEWVIAENVDDPELQEQLRKKRTSLMVICSIIFGGAVVARAIMIYLIK